MPSALRYFCRFQLILALTMFQSGCTTSHPPLDLADNVSLQEFMGPWFVQGYTPLFVDKTAHNAVEHYYLNDAGKIETTYSFRKDSFDGPLKTYTPTGKVPNPDEPAKWQMQFIWPFSSDYRILYLSDDGQQTIVVHPNLKYAWIMQREPEMSDAAYQKLLERLKAVHFKMERIQRLPQNWANDSERLEKIQQIGNTAPLAPR